MCIEIGAYFALEPLQNRRLRILAILLGSVRGCAAATDVIVAIGVAFQFHGVEVNELCRHEYRLMCSGFERCVAVWLFLDGVVHRGVGGILGLQQGGLSFWRLNSIY